MKNRLLACLLVTLLFGSILSVGLKVSRVSAAPVVDGVITPGEYDGGMAVQLVGRWNPSWTVDAFIAWDTEYVYVAVNEHVPTETGLSWIEFAIDPGSASTYLYAFAIFGTHTQSYVRYPKPNGGWSGLGTGNFSVMSSVATEFRVKYTDYGITLGNTIKLAIDRNNDSTGPPPRDWYGYAAFWPQGAVVYYGTPAAQPTTWGNVYLAPLGPTTCELTVNSIPVSGISYTVDALPAVTGTPITLDSGSHTITMPSLITVGVDAYNFAQWEDSSTNPIRVINLVSNTVLTATYSNHTIDGVIHPGEYDGGMAVQLVGRTDPIWTVDAYIAWDTEYLYVAVNEHVPPTTGHLSWIEFAIDPGPSSSYLYAFIIFDDHVQACNRYTKPSGPWASIGVGTFLVVSGAATEFRVKYTDYGMTPGNTIKMAIDRNLGPAPPPPYGFAAFWPQGAVVYYGTPLAQPATWGDVPPQPPHPCELTVNSIPVSGISYTVDALPAVTGTPITLDSGSHTITMPSLITVGVDAYNFAQWEDSSTNPIRVINLVSNTVLTATYSNHTIDGVISPGEYDDGMAVLLVGPYPPGAPFSPWTTDAYLSWDTEYLYVAANEPVPGTGKSSWIEFQFNTSVALHSFVLFADGTPQHVLYPLPSGGWYWDVPAGFDYPHPWYAATNMATEFQIKYTDYGIAYGDLLKVSIDRGKDDFTNPPLGECSVWPYPCTFYPTADASTWGNVYLGPSGPTTYELTVNSIPVSGISYTVDALPAVTGTPITLDSGSHTITMPPTAISGADIYTFTIWEDSSTNPVRTIDLQSNTVLTATYTKASPPDLEFVLVNPTPSKPFEYCKIFEVEVYATDISAHLTDYDFTIIYSFELLEFVDVDYWGVLGTGHVDNTTVGTIHIWDDPGGPSYTGPNGLLFALTFHVEFNDDIGHIWRATSPHELTAQVSFTVAELSFDVGTIPISGIIMPPPLDIVIHLIQGDVDCNGKVDISDVRTVAAFYDLTGPAKYDLKTDGTIDIFDLVVVAENFGYNT